MGGQTVNTMHIQYVDTYVCALPQSGYTELDAQWTAMGTVQIHIWDCINCITSTAHEHTVASASCVLSMLYRVSRHTNT